jgi:hypothetical protein
MLQVGVTNAVIHELPAIVSFPERAEFRVQSPAEIAIQANTRRNCRCARIGGAGCRRRQGSADPLGCTGKIGSQRAQPDARTQPPKRIPHRIGEISA